MGMSEKRRSVSVVSTSSESSPLRTRPPYALAAARQACHLRFWTVVKLIAQPAEVYVTTFIRIRAFATEDCPASFIYKGYKFASVIPMLTEPTKQRCGPVISLALRREVGQNCLKICGLAGEATRKCSIDSV